MPEMQEVPRPVIPERAPGPQAGQQAPQLMAEEKLEVNIWVLFTSFYLQLSQFYNDYGDRRTRNFELREIQGRKWFAYISISARNQESKGSQQM